MSEIFGDIKLKILVFGPNPAVSHPEGFTADLAKKRQEIRDALQEDGHTAVFPEDLMKGSLDGSIGNAYMWEMMLVREYDMIVNLVGSYGSVDELSLFNREELARKVSIFFNEAHTNGLAYAHAQTIEDLGGKLDTYVYPVDLEVCNLMKNVREKVRVLRTGKFFTS